MAIKLKHFEGEPNIVGREYVENIIRKVETFCVGKNVINIMKFEDYTNSRQSGLVVIYDDSQIIEQKTIKKTSSYGALELD